MDHRQGNKASQLKITFGCYHTPGKHWTLEITRSDSSSNRPRSHARRRVVYLGLVSLQCRKVSFRVAASSPISAGAAGEPISFSILNSVSGGYISSNISLILSQFFSITEILFSLASSEINPFLISSEIIVSAASPNTLRRSASHSRRSNFFTIARAFTKSISVFVNSFVNISIDRKRLQKLREKKIAMGHTPDGHEEYTGPTMSM
jgi:hypothetical protein